MKRSRIVDNGYKFRKIRDSQITRNHDLGEVPRIQLSYSSNTRLSLLPKISNSQDAYQVFANQWSTSTLEFIEQFKVMLLNRANKVIGILNLSNGGTTGTIAEPKLIFASSILANASEIILAHNHPSGNLKPSQADINLTKKLEEIGKLLEIPVLDHLIVTKEGYYSFADDGLI